MSKLQFVGSQRFAQRIALEAQTFYEKLFDMCSCAVRVVPAFAQSQCPMGLLEWDEVGTL